MNSKIPKIKIPHLNYFSVYIWLMLIAVVVCVTVLIIFYIASPYWQAKQLIRDLEQQHIVQLRLDIPVQLINENQANLMVAKQTSNLWKGAGANYIQQVWPKLAEAQDPYKLLLLQFNSASDNTIQRHYHYFPNNFKLTKGSGNNRVEFEWQRESWRTWRLSKLCFYNPQPFDDTKRCASSNR